MRTQNLIRVLGAGAVTLAAAFVASADCPTINFDNLAVGVAVTNQYPGVTFSLTFESATRRARIIDPVGGTTSGTRALGADQGSGGFYPGWLRMDFAEPHDIVTFRLGGYSTGVYSVRATNDVGGVLDLPDIDLEGDGDVAVHRLVTVNWANTVRIEIGSLIAQNQVIIDDLSFEIDSTPPVAELDEPDPLECACSPLQIRGSADDPDGGFFRRRIYYSQDEGGPWTLISNSSTPVNAGVLHSWNFAPLQGYYFLRLIAINDCDLETVVTTMVYLDGGFDTVEIRSPSALQVVGGAVCIDGTVWDQCPRGAASYRVLYGVPGAGGPIGPVDPDNATYPGVVVNDPLATPTPWITNAGGAAVADGTWRLAVEATDSCGHVELVFRDVVVDNTPPVAEITAPGACANICGTVSITGTASDAHLSHWYLEYTGGDADTWVPIADGAGPVVAGEFADWDTDGLRPCPYTIRLRVYDTAVVNCDSANYTEDTVSVNIGAPADFNRDGAINSGDFFDFLAVFFAPPPC